MFGLRSAALRRSQSKVDAVLRFRVGPRRFLVCLAATAVVVVVAAVACELFASEWRSGAAAHSVLETAATGVALATSVLILLRYRTRPTRSWQWLGVAMVGTALLDGLHVVLTLPPLTGVVALPAEDLIPWSWLASRTFLASTLLLWSSRHAGSGRLFDDDRELRVPDLRVLLIAVGVWAISLATFLFVPLPHFHSRSPLFGRPADFIPGVLFAAAAYQLWRQPLWRHNLFYRSMLLGLTIDALAQLVVMPRSRAVFDASFDFAHVLKIAGYGSVLVGVLHSIWDQLRRTAWSLRQTAIESATLRMLFEALPDAVYFKDLSERYVLVNKPLLGLLRRPGLEQIVGKSDRDLWPEAFAEWNRRSDREVLETGRAIVQQEHRLAAGPEQSMRFVLLSKLPCRNADDDVIGVLGVIRDITEAKRSQQALQRTQELLELATSGSSLGLWVWDVRTNHVWYSDRFRELLGYREGLANRFPDTFESFRSHLHSDDAPRVFRAIERHIESGEPYDVRYRLRCRDGTYRWFRACGRVVESEGVGSSRKPLRMAGSIQDVDDEMQTRAQLQVVAAGLGLPPVEFPGMTEQRFVLPSFNLEASITCGAVIRALGHRAASRGDFLASLAKLFAERFFADEGRSNAAFGAVRVYLGLRSHQLSGVQRERAMEVFGPDVLHSGKAFLVEVARAGDLCSQDDRSAADPELFVLSGGDWADRRPVVARLLRRLGMNATGGSREPLGRMVVNEGLIAGVHIEDVCRSSEVSSGEAERLAAQGVVSAVAFGGALPNGERFVVELLARSRFDAAVAQRLAHLATSIELALLQHTRLPNLLQCQIEAIDRLLRSHEIIVVDQEAQLEELVQSVKVANESLMAMNQELEHFLYIASHDLRAPLRHIKVLIDWIEEEGVRALPKASRRYLRQLRQRVDRLGMLLDSLLAYSRLGRRRGPERSVDVGELIRQATADLGLAERSDVEIRLPEHWPTLRCEEVRLSSVFRNLLGNAVEHNADLGRPLRIDVSWEDGGAMYRFRVQDDGKGIPAESAETVFGLFTTLVPRDAHESSGMGLAMVKKAVAIEGGDVWVEHPPEGGVAFVFTWPKESRSGGAAKPSLLPAQ
ncbi:MAG: PAS domain S-box protein [Planctomycetota bacterium]|nr:MAG: PAS domain S-box protein [Planctomycetota bacterium]